MSQNDQRRAHWTQVARSKADTELLVFAAAKKARVPHLPGPLSLRVVWFAPDARRRDVDSLAVFAKSCLDALQKGKVIDDDHSGIVHELVLGPIVISRDNPRIEVWIRGLEAGRGVPNS